MIKYSETKHIGKVGLMEPIIISGKSFGIKLLSSYDFLRCEIMYKNLLKKLLDKGFNKDICKQVCEYACVVSMCFYDSQNQRVFMDGFSAILGLTPEELKKIYDEYLFLYNKVISFDSMASGLLNNIKYKYAMN